MYTINCKFKSLLKQQLEFECTFVKRNSCYCCTISSMRRASKPVQLGLVALACSCRDFPNCARSQELKWKEPSSVKCIAVFGFDLSFFRLSRRRLLRRQRSQLKLRRLSYQKLLWSLLNQHLKCRWLRWVGVIGCHTPGWDICPARLTHPLGQQWAADKNHLVG